ncbi:MFS transporter [Paenibacillus sp. SC116]|uniref:MFS transporter n=1 Tax=Paenibacillus sp. SC116 TaxID=2968986 RepID=UPI00215ABC20|nr:MFS transporter [Paenibacillus sp. SC116]MCR8843405.1 MFS transporter [Paenibacillus sp. SC116]
MNPASPTREINKLRTYTFAVFMISAVIISYLPLYLKSLGYNGVQIGLLYSIGPLISICSNFIWGVASDKYQTIKKIILILLAVQTIMIVVLSFASSYTTVMMLLVVFYFFYYPVFPLTDTLTIVTTQSHNRSFIGVRVFGSIGFAFSALAFGYLLKSIGASYTLVVIGALSVLSFMLLLVVADKQASMKKMEFGGLWEVIKRPNVYLFLICVLLLAIGHRLNDAFLGLSLISLGADESIVGWAWMISAVSEIPVFFLLNAYGERVKELPLLAISCVMYMIRFLIAGYVQDPIWLISTQVMHSVTFGIFYFVAIRYLNRVIPEQFRSTGMAVYTIVWSSISGLLSGTIGGKLLEVYGKDIVFFSAAGFAIIAAIGFALLHLYVKRNEKSTAALHF